MFFIEKFNFSPAEARAVNRYLKRRTDDVTELQLGKRVMAFISSLFSFPSISASIVYIISAPASPVLGFLVDKTGRNVIWVLIAVVTTLAAHMMLAFTFWNPWIAMVMDLASSFTVLLFNYSPPTQV